MGMMPPHFSCGAVNLKHTQTAITTEGGSVYYDMSGEDNPCIRCGLCCRHFRVSFYHGELDSQPGGFVPAEMTVQVTPFRACMKGTETGSGRCVAFDAEGRCRIYAKRPSVCREFPAFMPDGTVNPECTRLKTLYGID